MIKGGVDVSRLPDLRSIGGRFFLLGDGTVTVAPEPVVFTLDLSSALVAGLIESLFSILKGVTEELI